MPADPGPLQARVISHLDLVIQLTTDTWGIPASIEFAVSASATLRDNAGLQLRRAISIQAEGKKLLENHATARQLQGFVRRRFDTLKRLARCQKLVLRLCLHTDA